MANKNTFKLQHHEPFTFVGDYGKYEIPPLEKLTYDQWKGVAELANDSDSKKILEAYKAFFFDACPELKKEEIGDNQWLQFGTAYFESMGE